MQGRWQILGGSALAVGAAVLLSGCETSADSAAKTYQAETKAAHAAGAIAATEAPKFAPGSPAAKGAELAETLCSGCHAVVVAGVSPNPNAPSFVDVANQRGLSEDTLATYLKDSHNFPERMNFEVVEEDADYLAAYMVTLQSDDYKPSI